jgi:enoyl-CoA hydratase/carnithine racemase
MSATASGGDGPVVLARREGPVEVITLNRPARLNAWTPELGRLYEEALIAAGADPEVRAIVVTGAGRGFCSGADMDVLGDASSGEERPETRPHSFVRALPKPVIAAINGPCVGVGFVMAMMCDLRFAAAGAKLTTAFARRGLIAEYGSAWVMGRSLGASRALDLLLSGRTFRAEEALALGVVDRVEPPEELLPGALAYATELAELSSPWSMAQIKRQVYAGMESGLASAEALADELMEESFGRPDLEEGVAAFGERRPPRFPPLGR